MVGDEGLYYPKLNNTFGYRSSRIVYIVLTFQNHIKQEDNIQISFTNWTNESLHLLLLKSSMFKRFIIFNFA